MQTKALFPKRARASDEMSLQITSMADIFTIILVFLLKSFSSSAVNINPSAGVNLPTAMGQETVFEALKIEISKSAVLVDDQPATVLTEYLTSKADVESNGTIRSLTQALEKARKRQLLIAEKNTDVKVDPKVVIVADKDTPYATIKAVLGSAAVNGFTDFKLAVIRNDS